MGSEEQQESSQIYSFYEESEPEVEWPSLTNMMLARIEIRERDLEWDKDIKEIETILEQYGYQGLISPRFW